MIETKAVKPLYTRLTSRQTCEPGDWVLSLYPSGWQQSTYVAGDTFVKGETRHGNRIDALPYEFEKVLIPNPEWEFTARTVRSNWPCSQPQTTLKCDGSLLSSVDPSILLYEFPPSRREFVDSMAILKAQASLRSALANVPMLFNERRNTVKTAVQYTTALLAAVRREQRHAVREWVKRITKHSGRNRRKAVAQELANRHLEFVFGVLPLIRDIEGLVEFLGEDEVLVRTGRGRMTTVKQDPPSVRLFQHGARKTLTTTSKYSVRTGLRCDITSKIANDLSRLGFNPVYTWYDMTPLSFVLGWVSNFNFWLQSLDPTIGLAYRTGYSSRRTETTVDVEVDPTRVGRNSYWEGTSPRVAFQCQRISQNRVVHETMPPLQELAFYDNTSLFAWLAGLSLALQRSIKLTSNEIKRKEFRYRGPKPKYLPPIRYRKSL